MLTSHAANAVVWPLVLAGVVAGCGVPVELLPEEPTCEQAAPLPEGGIAAVDTASTPRADPVAELLALEASAEFMAPQALYERVAGELDVLRERWPTQTHATAAGCSPSRTLWVMFTEAGAAQLESGQYAAWDAYNATLRVAEFRAFPHTLPRARVLTFEGFYNLLTVAQAYGELPEVEGAHRDGFIGDPDDVCLERIGDDGRTHLYIFYDGEAQEGNGDDCFSGCSIRRFTGFTMNGDGTAEFLGAYHGGELIPAWYANARYCRGFLRAGFDD